MKTTIIIPRSKQIEHVSEEFFGTIKEKKGKLMAVTFPSKKLALEFTTALQLKCVDVEYNVFK